MILEAACNYAATGMQAKYDARSNPAALKRLVGQGAKLFRFPKDMMDSAFKAALGVYDELSGTNPAWKKIYADYASFRRDENLWFRFNRSRLRRLHATAAALKSAKTPKSAFTGTWKKGPDSGALCIAGLGAASQCRRAYFFSFRFIESTRSCIGS